MELEEQQQILREMLKFWQHNKDTHKFVIDDNVNTVGHEEWLPTVQQGYKEACVVVDALQNYLAEPPVDGCCCPNCGNELMLNQDCCEVCGKHILRTK